MTSERLYRLATGRVTLAGTALFVLFVTVVLPAWTGQDGETAVPTPDLMLTYSATTLYQIAGQLGESGRADYIRTRFTFDVVWPLVYTFFLVTAISWLVRRGFCQTSIWQKANLLPLAAALFDLLENVSTSLVMARYPAETAVIAELAGVFTLVKWLLVSASFVALATVAFRAVFSKS